MASGMKRSRAVADHSSRTKSFQAAEHSRASSMSSLLRNSVPANLGNWGKHSAACTPSRSMSFTRSTGS